MLTACAWCRTAFPANGEVEDVPVGRRIALETQWRGAEDEAAISDDLLLPAGVREKLDALRRAVRHEP